MKDKWKYLYGGIMFFLLTAVTVGYSFYDHPCSVKEQNQQTPAS
jgi:hypothetical protein